MGNIKVQNHINTVPVSEQEIEYVERKGIGHPDSLIDGIVEKASNDLCSFYEEEAGIVLHYNIDKGLIIGGSSEVGFGFGKIVRPIEVIIAGRATKEFEGKNLDVDELVSNSAKEYLKSNTRFLDIDSETIINSKIVGGSSDLKHIFHRSTGIPMANDTSFGVGFAPFSDLERLVLGTEEFLNSRSYKKNAPYVGEDIKVMGVRENDHINLIVAIAFVSKFINSIEEYISYKEKVADEIIKNAEKYTSKDVSVSINSGDSHEHNSVYLTKSGLSCEAGDDGQVGRGNRVNGLITPFRRMSLEAAAGKNPINHVGKIYNILANKIASEVVNKYSNIKECDVSIVSQIGTSIDKPKSLNIDIIGTSISEQDKKDISNIAEENLSHIQDISKEIQKGKYRML
ncbi:MAG: methionine adenosyltransferase [Candidatus Micrarchaeia archaeon]